MKVISTKNNKAQIVKQLTENFIEDPLYRFILEPYQKKEAALNVFFGAYINYMAPESQFITDETENFLGVLWISEWQGNGILKKRSLFKFLFQMAKLISLIGIRGYVRFLKTIHIMSSSWIDEVLEEPYIHLDLAVTNLEYRGKGLFSQYLKYVEDNYKTYGQVLTLETQSLKNMEIYSHLGFELVRKIPLPDTALVQYCMIKRLN